MNDRIRAKEVRLVDKSGSQVGIVTIEEARRLSEENGLDLLLMSPDANPPVCKLVDIGQFKYEQRKKDKQSKKGKAQVTKELKMSPKISDHDYMVRLNSGKKFLDKKYVVKLTIFFKGRENARREFGEQLIQRYLDDIKEFGSAASDISFAPRAISVMINPLK